MATVAGSPHHPDPRPDVIRVCDRCLRSMRHFIVDQRITALICDYCGERQWLVNGEYATAAEALACALSSDHPARLIIRMSS